MKMWIYPQVRRVHWFSYFPSTHCHLLFFFSSVVFFLYILRNRKAHNFKVNARPPLHKNKM